MRKLCALALAVLLGSVVLYACSSDDGDTYIFADTTQALETPAGGEVQDQYGQPTTPQANVQMDKYLQKIAGDARVQNMATKFADTAFSKQRFKDHMNVVQISSPSRQEAYRGIAMAKLYKEAGFDGKPGMIITPYLM